jgi:Zn finger protein HypA/HybF involved in hydrogenase expression
MEAADCVRAAIAKDWRQSSMQPDNEGCVKHPLFGGVPAEWLCMHCDTRSTGAEMAANMWHCPKCSATPLDMHTAAWWKTP